MPRNQQTDEQGLDDSLDERSARHELGVRDLAEMARRVGCTDRHGAAVFSKAERKHVLRDLLLCVKLGYNVVSC